MPKYIGNHYKINAALFIGGMEKGRDFEGSNTYIHRAVVEATTLRFG